VCSSLDATVLSGDADGVAGLGFACREDVATEDPGVAARYARNGFAIDGNGIQEMARSRAMRSSVLGWVENIFRILSPVKGLIIQR
jgi:hypothetical protein